MLLYFKANSIKAIYAVIFTFEIFEDPVVHSRPQVQDDVVPRCCFLIHWFQKGHDICYT